MLATSSDIVPQNQGRPFLVSGRRISSVDQLLQSSIPFPWYSLQIPPLSHALWIA